MNVLVSPEDEHLLSAYRWTAVRGGYLNRMYRAADGRQRLISMHRQIMGDPVGKEVDHINGDPSDNRRENLRVCTRAENNRNIGVKRNNKLGVKGVYFDARRETYRAQIRVDGAKWNLGSFKTVGAAKAAYDAAAKLLHKDFAKA